MADEEEVKQEIKEEEEPGKGLKEKLNKKIMIAGGVFLSVLIAAGVFLVFDYQGAKADVVKKESRRKTISEIMEEGKEWLIWSIALDVPVKTGDGQKSTKFKAEYRLEVKKTFLEKLEEGEKANWETKISKLIWAVVQRNRGWFSDSGGIDEAKYKIEADLFKDLLKSETLLDEGTNAKVGPFPFDRKNLKSVTVYEPKFSLY